MVLHGRAELSLMSDEYGALTMVLLRFLAFPPQGAAPAQREPRAAPLRAPAPPAISVARSVPLPAVAPVPVGAPVPAPAPVAVSAPTPGDAALGDRWNDAVKTLSAQGAVVAMVKELATQAGLRHINVGATPPIWHLVVAREPLRNPALADKLSSALSALLGQAVALEIEAGTPTDTPALRDTAERQRRQEAAQAVIEQDPVVRDLLQQFKTARIVPGSIKPV